eukprot:6704198-Heterocapsa_arctica.AAC.1
MVRAADESLWTRCGQTTRTLRADIVGIVPPAPPRPSTAAQHPPLTALLSAGSGTRRPRVCPTRTSSCHSSIVCETLSPRGRPRRRRYLRDQALDQQRSALSVATGVAPDHLEFAVDLVAHVFRDAPIAHDKQVICEDANQRPKNVPEDHGIDIAPGPSALDQSGRQVLLEQLGRLAESVDRFLRQPQTELVLPTL